MVKRHTFNRLQRQIAELSARLNPPPEKSYRCILANQGESADLLKAKYAQEHPDEDCRYIIRIILWGVNPRPELCTRESVVAEIPSIRAQIERVLTTPGYGPSKCKDMRERQAFWQARK